ncbi:WXG100 family type VII secretion target [Gephyromycinifex aptenodytis]|uniref:WXG100 family type VII secretion target n=1 Tax=Gephyromycinifex aptenodytis TaxID=2716227 RepID=UPI00144793CA|nr:WXG100 family type VII secretion target [Gephyromycinifex aptenodytis]
MGTRYAISDNAINRHSSNLDASVAAMNANLNQFLSSLSALPGVWKGASFQSFDQVQTRWQVAARDLNQSLESIRGRVGTSGQIYDSGQAQQAADINSLNAGANWDAAKFRS